jgi:ferrous-iron efflux pump FieF
MTNEQLVRFTSQSSIVVAVTLTLTKLYAAYTTQSLSIISSLFDSSIDMLASIGNLIAITIAAKPADKKYQFGYGKLEAVSALIQSLLIIVSLLFLISEAIPRFLRPQSPISNAEIAISVMIISIFLTIGLTALQRYTIKRTQSLVIKADSLHYKTDLAVNMVVLVSLTLSSYFAYIDSMMCMFICAYMIWSTREIIRDSLAILLDKEIDYQDQLQIIKIINQHPQISGFHNFRTRSSGNRIFLEVHIEMDPKLTLVEAHHIAHELKDQVEALFPHAEMIVHQDPIGHDSMSEHRF